MKIFSFRFKNKFDFANSDVRVNQPTDWNPANGDLPCLFILHPSGGDQPACFFKNHKDNIEKGNMAVLALGTERLAFPEGSKSPYFHCLSYGIPSPNQDMEKEKCFRAFIEKVQKLDKWPAASEMWDQVWSLVDKKVVYPENLVAYYLALVAGKEHSKLLPELENDAMNDYENLKKAYGPVKGTFGKAGIKKLFEEMAKAL